MSLGLQPGLSGTAAAKTLAALSSDAASPLDGGETLRAARHSSNAP